MLSCSLCPTWRWCTRPRRPTSKHRRDDSPIYDTSEWIAEKINKLNGVNFNWKKEHFEVHGFEGNDVGIIAQEIKEVLPEAIRENDTGYLSVRYEKIIPLLIESIKEQQLEINTLNKQITFLMTKKP